jgi:hypothetical protein
LERLNERKSQYTIDKRPGIFIPVFRILTAGNSVDLLFIFSLCKKKRGLPGFEAGQEPDYLDDSDEIQGEMESGDGGCFFKINQEKIPKKKKWGRRLSGLSCPHVSC